MCYKYNMYPLIDTLRKSIGWKVLILCILTMLLFWYNAASVTRFVLSMLLYFIAIVAFNISYSRGVFFVLIGSAAAIVESIFIQYMDATWEYRAPDIFRIPYWLIPLWSIAIVVITQLSTWVP